MAPGVTAASRLPKGKPEIRTSGMLKVQKSTNPEIKEITMPAGVTAPPRFPQENPDILNFGSPEIREFRKSGCQRGLLHHLVS